MKAAMQAAMEMEGRMETLEASLHNLQGRFDVLQGEAATRSDIAESAQQAASAKEEVFGAIAEARLHAEQIREEMSRTTSQKADLDQVGQCVQAVRQELTEAVRRKASTELLEAGLETARLALEEAMGTLSRSKADAVTLDHHVQETGASFASLISRLEKDKEACAADMSRALDGTSQCIQEFGQLLESKTHQMDELAQQLGSKVAMEQMIYEVEQRVAPILESTMAMRETRDCDLRVVEQLQQSICDADQKLSVMARCKADADTVSQLSRSQAELSSQLQEKVPVLEDQLRAVVLALRQELNAKADVEAWTLQRAADTARLQEFEGRWKDSEQLQAGWAEELRQTVHKLDTLTLAKADKEKVVEIVEALRDEIALEVTQRLDGKADEQAVEHLVGSMREEMSGLARALADAEVVAERALGTQQALAEQVGRQAVALRQEVADASRPALADTARLREELHELARTVAEGLDVRETRSSCEEALPRNEIDAWMDQRMLLVKAELSRLVGCKADTEHVTQCMQAVRHEVNEHMEQRVQAAQHDLTRLVDRRAQAAKRELDQRIQLVEASLQSPHSSLSTSTSPPPKAVTLDMNWFSPTSPDRAGRVRQLLEQLVQ